MKFNVLVFLFLTFCGINTSVLAQHEHHQPPKPKAPPAKRKVTNKPASNKKSSDQYEPFIDPVKENQPDPPNTLDFPKDPSLPADNQQHQIHKPDTMAQHSHTGHSGYGEMHGQTDTLQDIILIIPHGSTHAFSRNLPMTRNGSGTSWNPDATPMYAYMFSKGSWNFMAHGSIFLRYTDQDIFEAGTRGHSKFDAPNWCMLMGQRKIGRKGLFNFNFMISLDPITEKTGYPLLFQSGETYKGKPLVDRQHPHDLFSEISIAYTHAFSEDIDLTGYFGYPGEPTIGPTAFMHRISSMNNPDAPLGHHWQDASHIQFGVATLGFRYKRLKLEGSNFTGREPDENRYNFDKPRFDSYSYRILFNPTGEFAFQFSQGFLKSPEELQPDENVTRTTASVLQSKTFTPETHLTSALIWGYNKKADHSEHSVLLEGNYQRRKIAYYGRYEFVQKDSEELQITEDHETNEHGHGELFNIHALTLGINRTVAKFWQLDLALGLQGSVYRPEEKLQETYGKWPVSGEVYLRLVPALMQMHHNR